MLVPFDTFGLALPVATALALVGPAYYAVQILENGDAAAVKNILIYFVVLGFVQTFESLMAGALQRNIRTSSSSDSNAATHPFPARYHVFKLIVLAYLAHTKTKVRSTDSRTHASLSHVDIDSLCLLADCAGHEQYTDSPGCREAPRPHSEPPEALHASLPHQAGRLPHCPARGSDRPPCAQR